MKNMHSCICGSCGSDWSMRYADTHKGASMSAACIDIRMWMCNGEIQHWFRCISLRYDFYKGTRRMKLLDSNEIRQLSHNFF